MAISFSAGFQRLDNFGGSTTVITGNSPNVSGADTFGYVNVIAIGTPSVSSVTWNGVAMTLVPSSSLNASAGLVVSYYVVNPPAGVSTVTVNGSWSTRAFANVNYATGVKQSAPIDGNAVTNSTASGTSLTTTKTTTSNNEYLISIVGSTAACTFLTMSSGTIESAGCDGVETFSSGWNSAPTAGSNSIVWNSGVSAALYASTFAINPAVSPTITGISSITGISTITF